MGNDAGLVLSSAYTKPCRFASSVSVPTIARRGLRSCTAAKSRHFTSFRAGASNLNLIVQSADRRWSWWGRLEGLFRSQLFSFQCACATGRLSSSGKSIFALLLPRV